MTVQVSIQRTGSLLWHAGRFAYLHARLPICGRRGITGLQMADGGSASSRAAGEKEGIIQWTLVYDTGGSHTSGRIALGGREGPVSS